MLYYILYSIFKSLSPGCSQSPATHPVKRCQKNWNPQPSHSKRGEAWIRTCDPLRIGGVIDGLDQPEIPGHSGAHRRGRVCCQRALRGLGHRALGLSSGTCHAAWQPELTYRTYPGKVENLPEPPVGVVNGHPLAAKGLL